MSQRWVAAFAALASLSLTPVTQAQAPEAGVSVFTSGSPYSFRPLDPYWAYRALPPAPPRFDRLNDNPIFMTSINFPGVYGAYTFGVTPTTYYDRSSYFSPAAGSTGISIAPTESALQAAFGGPRTARIDVSVPAGDAELTFNGTLTTPTGSVREFVTPALVPGGKYVYSVRVTWVDDGVRRSRDKNVFVQAGDRLVVDLTTGAGTFDGPSLRLVPEVERPAFRSELSPQGINR
jgi:uncharacterized protein (TIGR03000 family)